DEAQDAPFGFQDEAHTVPVVLAEPRPHEGLAPPPPDREAEERAERQPDRGVDQPPPRAEQRTAHRPRHLAGDGRDDDLQRLDRDEHDRRHPTPRRDRVLEKVLVAVEPDDETDDRGIDDHKPDDEHEESEQGRRDDRPSRLQRTSVIASGAHSSGYRLLQGQAASEAAEAARTVRSAFRRPTICRPTGKPSSVTPAGTLAAG